MTKENTIKTELKKILDSISDEEVNQIHSIFENEYGKHSVKNGHWFFTECEYFSCSICGKSYYNGCDSSSEAREKLENGDVYLFCPFCGSAMITEERF